MQRNFDPQSAKDIILGGGLKEGGVPGWVRTEASNTGEITTICNNKLEFLAEQRREGTPAYLNPEGIFFIARQPGTSLPPLGRVLLNRSSLSFFLPPFFFLSFKRETLISAKTLPRTCG